jgi:hypothetical protein
VAHAMNYDFVFRRRGEEEIGIRMDDDAAKAACVRELAASGCRAMRLVIALIRALT